MALKGFKDGGGDGLHKMPSGLIHTADSLTGGPRGTFISNFGPPGDPTSKGALKADNGIIGKVGLPKDYPTKRGGK